MWLPHPDEGQQEVTTWQLAATMVSSPPSPACGPNRLTQRSAASPGSPGISEAALTLWHYLGAFLLGSLVALSGAIGCAFRRRWEWAVAGFVPFIAGAIWILLVWARTDWESRFFDQTAWILVSEGVLLVAVWVAGAAAWRAAVHPDRRPQREKNHG